MLPNIGKILALDLGTRRTGLAICDEKQSVAFARPEFEHRDDQALLEQLKKFTTDEKVVGLLLGLPTKLSGEATEQTEKVRATAETLAALGLPIAFLDERLSTQAAENLHGFTTEEKFHDSRAAQILLEIYLSTHR